jgi:hypothetical protein
VLSRRQDLATQKHATPPEVHNEDACLFPSPRKVRSSSGESMSATERTARRVAILSVANMITYSLRRTVRIAPAAILLILTSCTPCRRLSSEQSDISISKQPI